MKFDRQRLLDWKVPEVRQTYTERDTMLYALGLGVGADPMDAAQLRFVYDQALLALPMMSVMLGYPGLWMADPETGIDWKRMLHGEQGFTIEKPLPVAGTVIGRTRVLDVIDKGADKGAVVLTQREVVDADSDALLCRLTSTSMLRGNGGFGGPSTPLPAPHEIPQRAPDHTTEIRTSPRSALIYRLSGDYNPLHVDPVVARSAGFERPILHGLCTFGMSGVALLAACCGYDASRLRAMRARFTTPVYPGETLRTEIWIDGADISFRTLVVERQTLALNNGWARLEAEAHPRLI